MTTPPKPPQAAAQLRPQEASPKELLVVGFDDLLHIFSQAEGRMKSMQMQHGNRGMPLSTLFFLLKNEVVKLKAEQEKPYENKMPEGAP